MSTRVGAVLREAGHDARHVADLDMLDATDERVMAAALEGSPIFARLIETFGSWTSGWGLAVWLVSANSRLGGER